MQRIINNGRRIKRSLMHLMDGMSRHLARQFMSASEARRDIFSEIYSKELWGGDGASAFFSGVGSRGQAAQDYVRNMARILKDLAAESGRPLRIVDLGCGDFHVGCELLESVPDAAYIGCDIVPALIEYNNNHYGSDRVYFQVLDIVRDALPEGDICLVRQVLQHLSNADICAFLDRQKYPLLYVTEGQPVERIGKANPDKAAGVHVRFDWHTGRGRGVELDKPPFNCNCVEAFRTATPPHEIIVTESVWRPRQLLADSETAARPL